MLKVLKILILLLILAALSFAGYRYWRHQQLFPSTDDAYVQAHVVNISPRISGSVIKVAVQNHQPVKKGQLLFQLDPTPWQIAVNKAQANLDNTISGVKALQAAVLTNQAQLRARQAELVDNQHNARRILSLVRLKLYAPAQGDNATQQLNVAKANVKAAQSQLKEAQQKLGQPGEDNARIRAAKAALANAQLNLQYTDIKAPAKGFIANFSLRMGDEVSAYQDLFAIVEDHQWWVNANFKETQLARIKPGQKAKIVIDIYSDHPFTGVVQSISAGSGTSFSLLPPEDATGNWVKVTQRFPVKIIITNPNPLYPLRIGASSTVTVNTKSLNE